MEALIYARFSKQEQGKGHTIERQLTRSREVCALNGWTVAPSRTLIEEGRSAYTGANRAKGSLLSKLESEIRQGAHIGRVFVVELLDRISRQGWRTVLDFMNMCSDHGVAVATWDGRRFYPAGEEVGMMEVMEIILKSEIAHKESATKGKRVRESFNEKRQAARDGEKRIASRPPSWLRRIKGGYEIIEDRAEIVREAHRLASIGHGTTAIAKIFNERGYRPWRKASNGWHESYILRMLKMRTVIGEYHSPRYNERYLDYYPAIIDVETFNRTQAAMEKRRNPASRGRRGTLQSSLFSGLTKCSCCGGSMNLVPTARQGTVNVTNRKGERVTRNVFHGRNYLKCVNYVRRLTNDQGERICLNQKGVRYERLEPAVLDMVMNLALDNDRYNVKEISEERRKLADVNRLIDHERESLETIKANLKLKVSATLIDMMEESEAKIAGLEAQRNELGRAMVRERGAQPSSAFLARIKETRAALNDPDLDVRRDARTLVRDSMNEIITDMLCGPDGSVVVTIAHGVAAFRVTGEGKVDWTYDASNDPMAMRAITTEAFEGNAELVANVIARAKAARRAS